MIVVGVVGIEEENLVQEEGITGIDNNKISSSSRIHSNTPVVAVPGFSGASWFPLPSSSFWVYACWMPPPSAFPSTYPQFPPQ
jgi:hypothetical protein